MNRDIGWAWKPLAQDIPEKRFEAIQEAFQKARKNPQQLELKSASSPASRGAGESRGRKRRKGMFHPDRLAEPRFTQPAPGVVIDHSNPSPPWEED